MKNGTKLIFAALMMAGAAALVGCQLTQNGQTLPSPYYLENQIQYFPAGTEFQYQKEVDQMNKERAERDLARSGQYNQ
ncbi:MAG: hypothetical protein Q4G68_05915 [Planctomycetia bacterium]|nr:hypothetical protein [Planctomycetia bacterium]